MNKYYKFVLDSDRNIFEMLPKLKISIFFFFLIYYFFFTRDNIWNLIFTTFECISYKYLRYSMLLLFLSNPVQLDVTRQCNNIPKLNK